MAIQQSFGPQNLVKMTMFSNAAWSQRVRVQVPERRSATFAGPGPNLPAVDRTFEGSGEGNSNFGTLEFDTGADGVIVTMEFTHAADGSTWHESETRVYDSSDETVFAAEDSSDGDFNDTIIKAAKRPYFN